MAGEQAVSTPAASRPRGANLLSYPSVAGLPSPVKLKVQKVAMLPVAAIASRGRHWWAVTAPGRRTAPGPPFAPPCRWSCGSGSPAGGDHPQVLDRPQPAPLPDPLHRAAVAGRTGHQPGRFRQEAGLAADLGHQVRTSLPAAQAGEDMGVHLLLEAAKLDLGEIVQKLTLPAHPAESRRQRRHRRRFPQVDLHPVALEVGDHDERGP
jgi:hypothetical protein